MSEEEKKILFMLKANIKKDNVIALKLKPKEIEIILNLIEKQQKEIEKFNNVLNEYVQDEDFNWKQISDYVEEYYISKYKIRDKIKELEELPNNQYIHLDYIKQEFKKLLEG